MRLFKLFTTALVLGLVGLFFYENAAVFQSPVSFTLDLYIREQVVWTHPLYGVLLFALLLGFLAGMGALLKPFLQMRRALGHERQEKDGLKAAAPPPTEPSEEAASDESVQPPLEVVESPAREQAPRQE